jgi:tetratricopeptide (TPR) repeat protein
MRRRLRTLPRCLSIALFALALTGVARADGSDDDAARASALYSRGMAHYQLEEYSAAIEKWEEGFRLKPVPEFLFNIAQAYRLSHRPTRALAFYRKFLRMRPDASNRGEVEAYIGALNATIEQQKRDGTYRPDEPAAGATQPRVATTPSAGASSASSSHAAQAASPAASQAPSALLAQAPARPRPLYKKGWFWAAVVGGAVVVGGGVALGVVLSRHSGAQTLPTLQF